MKKYLLLCLLVAVAFSTFAPHAYACTTNAECGSGNTCNLQGICVSNQGVLSGNGSSANGSGTLGADITSLIQFFNNSLVPLIFAAAFIAFLWGVFQYFILGGANEEKRKEGRVFILYGIIGLVVMLSIWGIVNLLTNSLSFGSGSHPPLPTF